MSSTAIVLITGANRGLGLETARQLLQKGQQVILSCRNERKGQEAVQLLQQEQLTPAFIPLDITDPQQIKAAYEWINEHYGRLDVLINNAAISGGNNTQVTKRMSNTILDGDIADFKAIYDVNVWGPLQLTRTLLPLLKKSNQGRIINVSSELGSIQLHADPGSPIYQVKKFGYNSSKTLLNLVTVYLQQVLTETGISVYAVSPGWVKTTMGTAAAPMEVPEGALGIVKAVTAPIDEGHFFNHQLQKIPW